MDYDILKTDTNKIIENLNLLSNNVVKIKYKIGSINKIFKGLETNKILVNSASNSYLLFQTNVLKNEYSYYKNLYDLILDKYSKEILDLSEYIVMVLISLNKLEINREAKQTIMNKIIHVKKYAKISYGNLNEIINSTINNLKLVDEFTALFNRFVDITLKKNKKQNIHNLNFETTITNKKDTILLEYSKYCKKFTKLIDYFKSCSQAIISQIDTSELLKFFLRDKSI